VVFITIEDLTGWLSFVRICTEFNLPEDTAKKILEGAEKLGARLYMVTPELHQKLAEASGKKEKIGIERIAEPRRLPDIEVPKQEEKTIDIVVGGIRLVSNNGLCNVTKLARDKDFLRIVKRQPYYHRFRGRVCYVEAWGANEFKILYEQYRNSEQKPEQLVPAEQTIEGVKRLPPVKIGLFVLNGKNNFYDATKLVEKYPELSNSLENKDYVKKTRGKWLVECDGIGNLKELYKKRGKRGSRQAAQRKETRGRLLEEWSDLSEATPAKVNPFDLPDNAKRFRAGWEEPDEPPDLPYGIMGAVDNLEIMIGGSEPQAYDDDAEDASVPKRRGRKPQQESYLTRFVKKFGLRKEGNCYDVTPIVEKERGEFKENLLGERYVSQKGSRVYIDSDYVEEFNTFYYAWQMACLFKI
jgi:hypothetical protein